MGSNELITSSGYQKLINLALKMNGLPKKVNVNNIWLEPSAFFTEDLALPIAIWLVQTEGQLLLGNKILPVDIAIDLNKLTGMKSKWGNINDSSLSIALVLTTNVIKEILTPSIQNPRYDYKNLLLNVKEKVKLEGVNDDFVPVGSWMLSEHIRVSLKSEQHAAPKMGRGV
ncbi:MAG: hypothetical protein HAW67_04195 [Endozoicomonadaceae bacterium]|nr:hypothetical protein [Endozoicomonadaceae bacterium]